MNANDQSRDTAPRDTFLHSPTQVFVFDFRVRMLCFAECLVPVALFPAVHGVQGNGTEQNREAQAHTDGHHDRQFVTGRHRLQGSTGARGASELRPVFGGVLERWFLL